MNLDWLDLSWSPFSSEWLIPTGTSSFIGSDLLRATAPPAVALASPVNGFQLFKVTLENWNVCYLISSHVVENVLIMIILLRFLNYIRLYMYYNYYVSLLFIV